MANTQTSVPVFTAGQVLTAQQQTEINTGIPVFATTTTRDAAFGGTGEKVLAEGQFAYIEASNTTQYYDGAAWQTLGIALTLIKTVTVGSGVTTVNVTDCFSSTYANYRVSWSGITGSAGGGAINYKLLVGTTPTTAGFYGNTFYVINGAVGSLTNANLSNSAYGELGNISSTYLNAGWTDILQPNAATATYSNYLQSDDNYMRVGAYTLRNTTQYDGIQLSPNSGTLTGGTIRVYGYQNS